MTEYQFIRIDFPASLFCCDISPLDNTPQRLMDILQKEIASGSKSARKYPFRIFSAFNRMFFEIDATVAVKIPSHKIGEKFIWNFRQSHLFAFCLRKTEFFQIKKHFFASNLQTV